MRNGFMNMNLKISRLLLLTHISHLIIMYGYVNFEEDTSMFSCFETPSHPTTPGD